METDDNAYDVLERSHSIKKIRKKLLGKMVGVKEILVDFICREDLLITTLKEFFEIFITSMKKE